MWLERSEMRGKSEVTGQKGEALSYRALEVITELCRTPI